MDIGEYIKILRTSKGLSQEELGKIVGVQRAAVQKWEAGKTQNLKRDTIKKLADFFEVNPANFIDIDKNFDVFSISGVMPLPNTVKKPRLGVITCGEPILAEENLEGYDEVPANIECDFTLRCKGDSMINARINDGDVVYIKQQSVVDSGQIAAVMIDNEATLKRVYIYDDKIILQPENPKYQPFVFIKEEINRIRILGRATGFTSKL